MGPASTTNALPTSVPKWPWLRLCRLVLTWRITRSCTCGPREYKATVMQVTITAYETVTRTCASRASSRSNIFEQLCARRVCVVFFAAWQLSASSQAIHGEVGRNTVLLSRKHLSAKPFGRHTQRFEVFVGDLYQCGRGYHQLAPGGPLHHPCRDVDVHPEPVRTDPLWSAGVNAHPHPRCIAVHVNGFDRLTGSDCGAHRGDGFGKDGHDTVAHPLDDVTAGLQQRWLDDLRNAAQQPQCRLVSGPQRPRRKAHQVGKDQRHLTIRGLTRHPFRQRLPHLERSQAHFA